MTEEELNPNRDPGELLPEEQNQSFNDDSVRFHGWRLVGIIFVVCVLIATVAVVVDWAVIGPLEGRAF